MSEKQDPEKSLYRVSQSQEDNYVSTNDNSFALNSKPSLAVL